MTVAIAIECGLLLTSPADLLPWLVTSCCEAHKLVSMTTACIDFDTGAAARSERLPVQ